MKTCLITLESFMIKTNMTEKIRAALKDMNRKYFDSHISNVIWSQQDERLRIVMDTKEVFEFTGEDARLMYKKFME